MAPIRLNWTTVFLIVLIMCSINFFELQMIKGSIFRYVQFGILLVAVIISVPYIFTKTGVFAIPVQLIFFSVVISLFVATFTWDQSFIDSLGGSVPLLVWGVFFYLNHLKIPVVQIEKIIIGYGILYLILYFFQFTHPDTGYFIKLETLDLSRGILRIVFPGRGLFYLTIFIAINQLTTGGKPLWFWSILSLLGIVVTIMQVTRQFILATAIIYLFHMLRNAAWYNKVMVAIASICFALYISTSDSPIVSSLKETQESNQELGADYVRIQGALFYLNDFSVTNFNRIFGNGVPYGETSGYNKYYGWLILNYGYWLSDVGLVAVYAMFGLFAVLGYCLIWINSFVIKVPKEYVYLKYYLWFLLITCLTSDTIYSSNDLIATVIVVYIYQVVCKKDQFVTVA